MQAIVKPAIVLGIAGALALGSMTPSQARTRQRLSTDADHAAGAAVSAAARHANRYDYGYGPGYEAYGYAPPDVPTGRYSDTFRGYDRDYMKSWHERQLEGRDY